VECSLNVYESYNHLLDDIDECEKYIEELKKRLTSAINSEAEDYLNDEINAISAELEEKKNRLKSLERHL